MSRVIEIQGDLDSQLRNAKTHVCVVDFYATWYFLLSIEFSAEFSAALTSPWLIKSEL